MKEGLHLEVDFNVEEINMDILSKRLEDIILEKNLGELTNRLYKVSQFCKLEQKKHKGVYDNKEVAKHFKLASKHILNAINEINKANSACDMYKKDISQLNIGSEIDFSKQQDNDYELGLRVGMKLESIDTGKVVEIKSFDQDKNALITLDPNCHPREKYIHCSKWVRIS